MKVLTLVTTCWSLHGHVHDTLMYVESADTGKPRISGSRYLGEAGVNLLPGHYACTPVFPTLTILGCLRGMQVPLVLQTHAYPPKLRQLSRLKHRYLALEERPWHQPLKATYYLPTILVLYNTLDPDVALAYLPTATVTISVVGMIMSLVLDHEYKKLILRVLNLVHEVEFNENGKAWTQTKKF